jgi:hypothetical protein
MFVNKEIKEYLELDYIKQKYNLYIPVEEKPNTEHPEAEDKNIVDENDMGQEEDVHIGNEITEKEELKEEEIKDNVIDDVGKVKYFLT